MTKGSERWTKRPEGSNWGEFGNDDELGRINLLTAERIRRAAREIREGIAFCLSLPLDRPARSVNPSRHPPRRYALNRGGHPLFNFRLETVDPFFTDVACDDAVLLHLQHSTQWDALCHVGSQFDADGDGIREVVYYNGWRGGEDIVGVPDGAEAVEGCGFAGSAANRLAIDLLARHGMQGRGVLVNLFDRYGREPAAVPFSELEALMNEQNVVVEEGDILCLYTGLADVILEMGEQQDTEKLRYSCCSLDGSDPDLLAWVSQSGVAAIAADNYGVESFPYQRVYDREQRGAPARDAERTPMIPLHELCLFKLGIPLGELWYLRELAEWLGAHGRNRFFLTAPPLRLPQAAGSPVTPVATV